MSEDPSNSFNTRFQCCALPQVQPRQLKPDLDTRRVRLIVTLGNKWSNGTTLTFYFFDSGLWAGPTKQMEAMRQAFAVWRDVGIGLTFKEVTDIGDADIRIGFEQGAGSWSYLGRDILNTAYVKPNERTMNIGWDISSDIDTGIHEIGHTLGFPHEHQNPNAGIVWDEEAVYADLAGPPNNWSRDKTFYNIIRKIDPDDVQGSVWDPDSIMHYPFKAGMIMVPEEYKTQPLIPQDGLSDRDKAWVKKIYPPIPIGEPMDEIKVDSPMELNISEGEQKSFAIQLDGSSGTYEIETIGFSDTYIVVFEKRDDDNKMIASDDDSGEEKNAKVTITLDQSKKYILRVRLYWSSTPSTTVTVVMRKAVGGGGGSGGGNIDDGGACCIII